MERRSGEQKGGGPESSVGRALRIIEALASGTESSLGRVAQESGLSKPTAHRLLRILVDYGWAEQSSDGLYAIGARGLAMGGLSLRSISVTRRARSALQQLRLCTPETIHLAVLRGFVAVYVDKIEGSAPYQMASRIGMELPLYCTAIGKAILAHLEPQTLAEYLRLTTLTPRTPKTIADPDELMSTLTMVRALGYAIDDEENESLIRCVGAPIFDARGLVIGGISVSAPTFQLSTDEATSLARHVVATAESISRECGARPQDLPSAWASGEP